MVNTAISHAYTPSGRLNRRMSSSYFVRGNLPSELYGRGRGGGEGEKGSEGERERKREEAGMMVVCNKCKCDSY